MDRAGLRGVMPDHVPDPYESDDEDGFPWDADRGLPFGDGEE